MVEKELKTRIQLKYDTLENWTSTNPVLYSGEIAIVAVPTESGTTVEQVTKPAVVFKVGDGTSNFNTLPYASGLAADVYAWAKASEKPSYSISEIEGWNDEILDDEIKSLITEALTAFLQSADFESQVIADVTSSVETALETAESYADTAIQNLGSATATTGSYISGISIDEEGKLTITEVALSDNYYNKDEVDSKLGEKQDALTFDNTPITESQNPVTSGGIYSAIQAAIETAEEYTNTAIADVVRYSVEVYDSYDNLPNPGSSGVIYFVACEHEAGKDIYDEYIWIQSSDVSDSGYYEKIGNTDIDLTDYVTTEALEEAIKEASETLTASAEEIKQELESEITTLLTSIDEEVEERESVDTSLQTQITTNANSIDTLNSSLTAETAAREEADAALQSSIDGVSSTLETETSAREEAEAKLQESIDTLASAVESVEKYEIEAGDGLKVTADSATVEGTTTFTVNIDDDVTFVFNGGNAEGYAA